MVVADGETLERNLRLSPPEKELLAMLATAVAAGCWLSRVCSGRFAVAVRGLLAREYDVLKQPHVASSGCPLPTHYRSADLRCADSIRGCHLSASNGEPLPAAGDAQDLLQNSPKLRPPAFMRLPPLESTHSRCVVPAPAWWMHSMLPLRSWQLIPPPYITPPLFKPHTPIRAVAVQMRTQDEERT
jgi:hypothetical protein